ncbi:MAG: CpsD/CapB family tyrosine-protein kinase [Bacillota bacterium]
MNEFSSNGAYIDLVAHRHPKAAAAEAYRTLRTNLGFAAPDRAAKVILITSAGPEEGKTTTAGNLAVVLAQAGHGVCLLDADLRKPRLHKVFGVENEVGLTNVLSQNLALEKAVVQSAAGGVALLPSGPIPPNPAELLGSGRMKEVLGRLAERYDFVLVDSPPVLAVTDASLLAARVDGVLLVIRAADTRVEPAQEAKARLEKTGGRILGVTLNKVRLSAKDYSYYYYYHHRPGKEDQVRL